MLRAPRRKPDTAAPPIHIGYTDGSLTMTSKKSVPSSSTIYTLERNPVNVTMRPPKIWRRCAMCDVKTGDLRPTSRHAVTRAGSRRVEDHNGFGHFRIQRRTAHVQGIRVQVIRGGSRDPVLFILRHCALLHTGKSRVRPTVFFRLFVFTLGQWAPFTRRKFLSAAESFFFQLSKLEHQLE